MTPFTFHLITLLITLASINSLKVAVFGASGGVGQLICRRILDTNSAKQVVAVSRDIKSLERFDLLKGCDFVEADALKKETLKPALSGADYVIISVGTTAFPTDKWKNGNTPKVACLESVRSILEGISEQRKLPKKVILLSSIGVERANQFPFKILNAYGVLDAKRESEELLFRYTVCKKFSLNPRN
jgi:uncharacterized protein YbjT (DUF2867 family)